MTAPATATTTKAHGDGCSRTIVGVSGGDGPNHRARTSTPAVRNTPAAQRMSVTNVLHLLASQRIRGVGPFSSVGERFGGASLTPTKRWLSCLTQALVPARDCVSSRWGH